MYIESIDINELNFKECPAIHTNTHAKSIRVNYLKYRIAMNKFNL